MDRYMLILHEQDLLDFILKSYKENEVKDILQKYILEKEHHKVDKNFIYYNLCEKSKLIACEYAI